ncbi:MAG TPA: c-type cytochrome biogenesis protein CcsB [Nocardioidaceae bacterium]|nr:c-type cytochrome biogenesis protein CcsB [Nocardioidaceae bacterium]
MTHTFAQLSNNAVYSATFVFCLAMVAHIVEWAMARQVTAAPVRERQGALVAAGAGPTRIENVTPAAPPQSADDAQGRDRFGRIGFSLTVLGMLVLLLGVVSRGIAAQRVPWGSMYEFTITCSVAIVAAYVVLVKKYGVRWLGLPVTAFLTLALGIAVVLLYRPVEPLVPALHSYWLYIHVTSAAIAGGAYTVGALASLLYLARARVEARAAADPERPRTGFLWQVPSTERIDRVAYRVHAFAFPMWTFAVLCGAIWAQYAWGRFWGWDPKETWAFITWVCYAAYLHARATAGWKGKAAAYIALVGYSTFLFNFIGINLFGSGLHSYAGV